MAEAKRTEQKQPEQKASVVEPELKPASESTDAAVQQLLAQRSNAVVNGDSESAERVTADLAERGYK